MAFSNVLTFQIGWIELGLASLLLFLYFYHTWTSAYTYWKTRNVPYMKPKFPFGNLSVVSLSKKNFRDSWQDLYREIENRPFCGIYITKRPILLLKDPELIKRILAKDFSHFSDRGWIINKEYEPLLYNIFFMQGESWKNFRSQVAPAFSTGKMKIMFPIMNECANQFKLSLHNISKGSGIFEVKDLMSRFTMDIISNSVFGVNANSVNDPNCHLYNTGKQIFERSLRHTLSNLVFVLAPKIYCLLKLHLVGYEASVYFADLIKHTIEHREKTRTTKNDFVDILVRLKNNLGIDDAAMFSPSHLNTGPMKINTEREKCVSGVTLNELLAQALTFYFAGFETTANTISFCLYELSTRPDLQLKIQEELDAALQRYGCFTYQMMQELHYLDNVISETLRRYSVQSTIDRVCVKPYNIPDTDVIVEKGCKVIILSSAIHHDPTYYPDPYKFDPDRFLEENVKSRPSYTFLPFGEGPRICIGWRFARMEMRLALATFFSQFSCKLNPLTRVPLTIARWEIATRTRDDILVDVIPRNTV